MKNIALVLPLTIALLLSACNNTNDQTDNSRNDQASENIDTLSSDEVILPTPEKTEEAPQIKDEIVDNDSHKKDIIKFLYRDAVLSLKNDDTSEELDTLYAYADRDLQNAIALVKADSMNTYDGSEYEISECSEVRYILNLSVGNGYSIDEAADVKYKVLNDGKVRASIMLDDDENIDDSNFDNYKDFLLNCSSEGCKIADMFDSYGDSALQAVEDSYR